jgi:hypothetical protein
MDDCGCRLPEIIITLGGMLLLVVWWVYRKK